jgi:replicative DNA helicase
MANVEDRVISAVLNDKQVHVLMQANVDGLFKTHADIWNFIKDYSSNNGTVPPTHLVVDKFRDFEPIPDIGSTKHHLDELREHYLNESLKSILKSSASELQSGRPIEALNTIISQTADLKKSTANVRDLDVIDIDDAVAYFNHIRELNERGDLGIKTGLKAFDDYLPSGIAPGNFGILLAYPAIGKSWLALFLAVQAWRNNRKPLFVSLEMSESEVRNRAYTIMGEGRFSHKKLSAGDVDLDQFQTWGKKHLQDKPSFQIISNDGIGDVTPAVLRGKIDQYKPDIVFVDYIQLMQSNARTDNEVVKIKNISRELKILAISEQVPIIAIASATPDDASDMHSVPTLGQVAWSKQLSYDADWVLALGRAANSDVIEAAMRKNRNGALGEFLVMTDFDHGRFTTKDFDDDI